MKALLKSGMFLALGWLANHGAAQETKWHATSPQNSTPIVSPQTDNSVRGVSLSQPVPLGNQPGVVRAQMGHEPMILQPLPKIEDQKPLTIEVQKPPITVEPQKPLPKGNGPALRTQDNGNGKQLPKDQPPKDWPAPQPELMPTPVYSSLGFGCDDNLDCGMDECYRPGWGHRGRYLCAGGDCCPPRPGCWISAEYLMWWQKGQFTPPLVASSPVGTSPRLVGVLPGATSLYDRVPDHTLSGARISGGFWTKHFPCLGVDASFFFTGQLNTSHTFTSDGTNALGRPFQNVNPTTGAVTNASEPFSTPTRNGYVRIDTFSQLWGADINLRYKLWCGQNCWVDLLAGYRHVNLREGIAITEDFVFKEGDFAGAPAGQRSLEQENFATRNIFHGAQIGLQSHWQFAPRWSLDLSSKIAFGSMTQIVTIDGSTLNTLNGAVVQPTGQGALLAVNGTNIGRYQRHAYAFVPEVGLKLNYNITDNLSVYVGYDVLYLSNVVRPGDQIDPVVNQTFRPGAGGAGFGPIRPSVLFQTTNYWAQGMNAGMRYVW